MTVLDEGEAAEEAAVDEAEPLEETESVVEAVTESEAEAVYDDHVRFSPITLSP